MLKFCLTLTLCALIGRSALAQNTQCCAIDPVWDDGDGNILYYADFIDVSDNQVCLPCAECYFWGDAMTLCPDNCIDGCTPVPFIGAGRMKSAMTDGRPVLVKETQALKHLPGPDELPTSHIPTDFPSRNPTWHPRNGAKVLKTIPVDLEVDCDGDVKNIFANLFDTRLVGPLSKNPVHPYRTLAAHFGVEHEKDANVPYTKITKEATHRDTAYSVTVFYENNFYLVVTKTELNKTEQK